MNPENNPYESSLPAALDQPDPQPIGQSTLVLVVMARTLALTLTVVLCISLLSSLGNPAGAAGQVHRWTGHLLVILVWVSVPFALVVLLIYKLGRHPFAAIGQSLFLLLSLPIALIASFTGYLGPIRSAEIGEQASNRFYVLHMCILPSVLAVLFIGWFFIFRTPRSHTLSDR
jgi:hypothetical protein